MRILLIDADAQTGNNVAQSMRQAGFAIDPIHNGDQIDFAIATQKYELIVLDPAVPTEGGIVWLESLRSAGNNVPVIMISTSSVPFESVKGLLAGADDYMAKPLYLPELIARCCAVLRRANRRWNGIFRCRDLTVDLREHRVFLRGLPVALTMREYAILAQLVQHPGNPQSRTLLHKRLSGSSREAESNAVEVHISKLRKKLGENMIRTVRGIGYVVDLP